ncbi:TVP38/TMEM64 family protein [Adhaeretor mobilis]|uniref:TVP38/TMEM64 family membrane protein n=1 Tax=Adhaeretor mobilis TaxID=1930276 RepID=A0A517MZG9_9BACT|nr:TVP38/TMEM64 family protein [Adhaeretor mobilis]QDT00282.1 TVP38/TMEM64 family inner membrane protein YdjZ [Adhaeretor mobilis]
MTKQSSTDEQGDSQSGSARSWWLKGLALCGFLAAIGVGYYFFADQLSLKAIAEKESALQEYRQAHPVLVYVLAFGLYAMVTGLSLPGAVPLSLAYGWFFDLVPAIILVSFASTTGATIAFLVSRYLLRDIVKSKFGERLSTFEESLESEGPFYLFTLRLIPAVPFFVLNIVMGLTPIRVVTFWWVSQLGMLAGTIVYVYAGHTVPSITELAEQGASGILSRQLIIAFIVLGTFPLVVKYAMKRWKGTDARN